MANATKDLADGYQDELGVAHTLNIDPSLLDASVDGQGGTLRGKPVFTADEAAFYLNRGDGIINYQGVDYESGAQWYGAQGGHNQYYNLAESKVDSDGTLNTLAFGFYETLLGLPEPYLFEYNGDLYAGLGVTAGFSAFDADQRAAARDAIQQWDDLIAVSFVEKGYADADINFMNTTTGPIQASAYLPYAYSPLAGPGGPIDTSEISGDVFVNPLQASNHQFDEGQYGLTTLIHELGHTLGLEHPGSYNFGPGFSVNYTNGAEYYQDSNQYTIMSYWGANETGAANIDWNTLQFVYQSTPGVHDILAIQRIYGADMTTRTGDTTYGFNSNAGRDAFDFDKTPMAEITIWDAGGNDTIDVSGYSSNSTINLNAGSFSSAGGSGVVPLATLIANGVLPEGYTQAQYDNLRARYNSPDGLLHDNISIAYGAIIENAVTGAGNDTIIANEVVNRLDGGAGFDTVSYAGAHGGVTASLASMSGTGGDAAGDRYINMEALSGSNFGDMLLGGNRADTINGLDGNDVIAGGNQADTLSGGAGNDQLDGGNDSDSLFGGAGLDFLNGGNGNDSLDGGSDADSLNGGNGNDVINGGAGDDFLTGGNGNDTFLFTETGGHDVITDFRHGQDKIDLSDIDAITGNTGHDAFTFVGGSAFSGHSGELRSYSEGGHAFLAGDVDGNGVADFTIQTNVVIVHSDIIFG